MTAKWKWDWTGAEQLERAFSGGAAADALLRDVAVVYLAYLKRRYETQSRGGGEWPDLAPSTLTRKRYGKKKGAKAENARILRNLGLLLNALNIGAAGNAARQTGPTRYEFGFADAPHGAGGPPYRQLAIWHDQGTSRMPQRQILVLPDDATVRVIERLLVNFVKRSTPNRR